MITIKLGLRFKELRVKDGLSQEKFAMKVGLDRSYYASVEKGRRNISINNIKKIAEAFEISLSELFNGID